MSPCLTGAPAPSEPDSSPADHAAIARIVERAHGRLVAVARRILHDDDEARDVVQDACLHALRGIAGFRARARLSTWLHRIVVNAALMRLRTRRRRREESLDAMPAGRPPFAGELAESAEAVASGRQQRALLRRAIARLPERHRTVLVLRGLEELDTAAAARSLGLASNGLKIRLYRARKALRAEMVVMDG